MIRGVRGRFICHEPDPGAPAANGLAARTICAVPSGAPADRSTEQGTQAACFESRFQTLDYPLGVVRRAILNIPNGCSPNKSYNHSTQRNPAESLPPGRP